MTYEQALKLKPDQKVYWFENKPQGAFTGEMTVVETNAAELQDCETDLRIVVAVPGFIRVVLTEFDALFLTQVEALQDALQRQQKDRKALDRLLFEADCQIALLEDELARLESNQ